MAWGVISIAPDGSVGGEEGTDLGYGIVGRHLRPCSEKKHMVDLKESSPQVDDRNGQ